MLPTEEKGYVNINNDTECYNCNCWYSGSIKPICPQCGAENEDFYIRKRQIQRQIQKNKDFINGATGCATSQQNNAGNGNPDQF